MISTPEIGQLVVVRKRPFVVTEIIPSVAVPSSAGKNISHLLKLSSVEDDGLGEELQVIWELEPGTTVHEKSTLPDPDSFDHPKRLQAFLDAVRWGAVSQADDKTLQSPFRSGIEVDEYQLDPVVRALSMPRVNLLIADDVGLGKTIEAGLVVQEMILRHRVRTVMIVCPSSLQIQWQDEMKEKFNIDFTVLDSDQIYEMQRTLGMDANPWKVYPHIITSMDYLKQSDIRTKFIATAESLLPTDAAMLPWDLLIVDEVHNFSPGHFSDAKSDRHLMLRDISPFFEHRLFLSATP